MQTGPPYRILKLRSGQPMELSDRIAIGGEGTVYAVSGQPSSVAKIYNSAIAPERVKKLEAMIQVGTPALAALTAWPSGLLFDGTKPVGFIMPRATKAEEVHQLYGLKSRRKLFPEAGFRFLVHTAMNVARAFAVVHRHGIVIGDVNERGVMIGHDAQARLIDCDSFQLSVAGEKFFCEVGVPTFTPPELQKVQTFRGVQRTEQNDAFGLAILLFHLLFLGRHPFAGRYVSPEMPIERAIQEYRFAYSGDRQRTQMEQPPNTPKLGYSGASLTRLFEQAFAPALPTGSQPRPSAAQWADALEAFLASLVACNQNAAHAYVPVNGPCPWCAIELTTRVDLFSFVEPTGSTAPAIDYEAIWQAIESLQPIALPVPPDINVVKQSLTLSPDAKMLRKYESEQQRISSSKKGLEAAARLVTEHNAQLKMFQAEAAQAHAHVAAFDSDGLRLVALQQQYAALPAVQKRNRVFRYATLSAAVGSGVAAGAYVHDPLAALAPIAVGALAEAALYLRQRFLARRSHTLSKELHSLRGSIDLGPDHRKNLAYEADQVVAASRNRLALLEADHNAASLAEHQSRESATVSGAIVTQAKVAISDRYDSAKKSLSRIANQGDPIRSELSKQWQNALERRRAAQASYAAIKSIEAQRTAARKRAHDEAREAQLSDHLDRFFIASEPWPRIPKSTLAALSSYGIETAADINRADVLKVPGFGEARTRVVLEWRAQKEVSFRFDPSKGDHSSRLQQEDRRLISERRPHERELSRIKAQFDSIVATMMGQRQRLEQEVLVQVRQLAQCLVDSDTLRLGLAPVQLPRFESRTPSPPRLPPQQQASTTFRPTYTPPPKQYRAPKQYRKRRSSKRWRSRTW